MSKVLVLNSSVSGEASVSRKLVADAVAAIRRADPHAEIVWRDLAADPIPHLLPETVAGVRAEATTGAEHTARALSDELIAELKAADTLVVGAPMYNFSVPTTLRSWFDHVLRAGVTFTYKDGGPQGLVGDKKVVVVESRGGLYSEGPAKAADFQEGYLRHLFGFIGLDDVTFIRAEKIGFGPEARAAAIEGARAEIGALFESHAAKAA